jgi:F0F1-type ATP synthase delta subunit
VSIDLAWASAEDIYKKVFDVTPKKDEVEFLEKESLKGGIKVYFDDKVVDLSFDKVERALKNSS